MSIPVIILVLIVAADSVICTTTLPLLLFKYNAFYSQFSSSFRNYDLILERSDQRTLYSSRWLRMAVCLVNVVWDRIKCYSVLDVVSPCVHMKVIRTVYIFSLISFLKNASRLVTSLCCS